jgi:hypothetical protein
MSESFEQRCVAAVTAVEHSPDCACRSFRVIQEPARLGDRLTVEYQPCDCDRDARIGKGMAAGTAARERATVADAVRAGYYGGGATKGPAEYLNDVYLAAFAEAAK